MEEKTLNMFGHQCIFFGIRHILFKLLSNIQEKGRENEKGDNESTRRWIPVDFCPGKVIVGMVSFHRTGHTIEVTYRTILTYSDRYKDITLVLSSPTPAYNAILRSMNVSC